MSEKHRRRIDDILDPSYLTEASDASPGELRAKLRDARTEEEALSYVRRTLHGRLDLLRAEIEHRRGGRGTSRDADSLISALRSSHGHRGGRVGLALRAAAVTGRRGAERVLGEDHLARLPDMNEEEIEGVISRVTEAEQDVSADRQRLHAVIDTLESELADRYKAGLEPSLERLQ